MHCFEATPARIPELQAARQHVHHCAVYDCDKEEITFNVVHGVWGGGSLTAGVSAVELDPRYMASFGSGVHSIEKVTVRQVTLNTILPRPEIDIPRIDVEGGELKVLQGLDLDTYRPKVVLVEDIYNDADLHAHLLQHGYVLDQHISYNKYYIRADAPKPYGITA